MRWRMIALGCLGVAGALASCVGEDPHPLGSGTPDASGGDDAATGSDGASGDGADAGGGGADAAVDACTGKDLANDQRHCGSCFHDCVLGACTGGTCEPWIVTTAAGTVTGLDVDGTGDKVYFGVGADVWRVQPDGGSPEKLTTMPGASTVSSITRSGLGMLACSSEGIHQVPPNAGAATPLFPAVTTCTGIAADGTTIWASNLNTIYEVRTATSTTLQHPAPTFPNQPSGELDVDGLFLYFLTDNNGVRRLAKTAIDGGSTRVGPDTFSSPQGLAVRGDHVYVTAFTPRALSRIAIDGGAATELVSLDGGGFTYSQRAAHAPTGLLVYYSVGSRVMGFVPP